jgi:hypothetical protein
MILKHTHLYKRHTYSNGEQILFCTRGECDKKINVKLALGKPAVCWRCQKEFTLNEYSLRLAKPHCMDCKKRKHDHEETTTQITPSIVDDLRSRLDRIIEHPVSAEDDLL